MPVPATHNSAFVDQQRIITDWLPGAAQEGTLWKHQQDALIELAKHFADPCKPHIALVVLPTGCGKSGIAALAPYVLGAKRVLVITPSIEITEQLTCDFNGGKNGESFYKKYGIITINLEQFLEPAYAAVGASDDLTNKMSTYRLVIANAHKFGTTSNINIAQIPTNLFDLVIVDEAHHYPAPTWKRIIDHFQFSRRVFLTATPSNRGQPILDNQDNHIAFQLKYDDAVSSGVIRRLKFDEEGEQTDGDAERYDVVGRKIIQRLREHDAADSRHQHQAMILTFKKEEANKVEEAINTMVDNNEFKSSTYHGDSKTDNLDHFKNGQIRILVVCGKLLEGFDRKEVSVVGIVRNVARSSHVFFNQFVGRSVRKLHKEETIDAYLVSHVQHKQQVNFNRFDCLADDDPEDD